MTTDDHDRSSLHPPPHLICHLSQKLMADPVVIATGQTYERAFILRWLADGNRICPKSRQRLSHTDVIPNFTVKALISSWCETHGVPLPKAPEIEDSFSFLSSASSMKAGENRKKSFSGTLSPVSPPIESERVQSRRARVTARNVSPQSLNSPPTPDRLESASRKNRTLRRLAVSERNKTWAPNDISDLLILGWGASDSNNSVHGATSISSSPRVSGFADDIGSSPPNSDRNSLVTSDAECFESSSEASAQTPEKNLRRRQLFNSQCTEGPYNFDRTGSVLEEDLPEGAEKDVGDLRTSYGEKVSSEDEDIPLEPIVKALREEVGKAQMEALEKLRILSKFSMVNRTRIAAAGGIDPLVRLLRSKSPEVVEQGVTALLNVSINEGNKGSIAAAGAIPLLIHVLRTGTGIARENAAATLFSLSRMDENKVTIGASGAIQPLVDLLINGSFRGKKDACMALFMLSIYSSNKSKIVRAGAVKQLVQLIDLSSPMLDKASAVLANLSSDPEGRASIVENEGIPPLVEVLESATLKAKENACTALLYLSSSSPRHRAMILQEGAIPPLVALTQVGSSRSKEKASLLLKQFREQRQSGLLRHGSLQ